MVGTKADAIEEYIGDPIHCDKNVIFNTLMKRNLGGRRGDGTSFLLDCIIQSITMFLWYRYLSALIYFYDPTFQFFSAQSIVFLFDLIYRYNKITTSRKLQSEIGQSFSSANRKAECIHQKVSQVASSKVTCQYLTRWSYRRPQFTPQRGEMIIHIAVRLNAQQYIFPPFFSTQFHRVFYCYFSIRYAYMPMCYMRNSRQEGHSQYNISLLVYRKCIKMKAFSTV